MNENLSAHEAVERAAAQAADCPEEALRWLHKARKQGWGRKRIAAAMVDHILASMEEAGEALQSFPENGVNETAAGNPCEESAEHDVPCGASHVAGPVAGHEGEPDHPPCIVIDSKSLPRSGLHYLKNTLARLLGDQFSFCEWYHEPGCCQNRPCSIGAYAKHSERTGQFRLRLIKSHDFDLNDPKLEPGRNLQRLILVRDPLFTLTSWFELTCIETCKEPLIHHGIHLEKIWLLHEKEVVEEACRVLDRFFEPPSDAYVRGWLETKIDYIANFMNHWAKPAIEEPDPHVHLIDYEGIQQFVIQLLGPYQGAMDKSSVDAYRAFAGQAEKRRFEKRKDPFAVKSKRVTDFLREHAGTFAMAAEAIIAKDRSGYLRSLTNSRQ